MAFKLIALKAWKPAIAIGTATYAAYGYQKWNSAQAALKIKPGLKDEELLAIFSKIDVDNSGTIDKSELQKALNLTGMKFSDTDVDAMFYAADEDHNASISKEEWLNICKHIHHQNHSANHPSTPNTHVTPPKIQLTMKDVTDGVGHSHTKK